MAKWITLPTDKTTAQTKTRIIFLVDDSGSISNRNLREPVLKFANEQIMAAKKSAYEQKQTIIASIWKFSVGLDQVWPETDIQGLPLVSFPVHFRFGGDRTWLFGAVEKLVRAQYMETDPSIPTLLMVLTDGEDNHSTSGQKDALKQWLGISNLTIAFCGPRIMVNLLGAHGVPSGNMRCWDNEGELRDVSADAVKSVGAYVALRSTGVEKTKSFFADVKDDVLSALPDVKAKYRRTPVEVDVIEIAPFVEQKTKKPYLVGSAYYLLHKPETIGPEKKLIARHKKSGKLVHGDKVKEALGIPSGKIAKVKPGNLGDWDIFVLSTSMNRKLHKGDYVIIAR